MAQAAAVDPTVKQVFDETAATQVVVVPDV